MIPKKFTADGFLPPGDYEATLNEIRKSILVLGEDDENRSPNWDADWRGYLVDKMEQLVAELWQIGVTEIFVDGSFAEAKDHPNDIDGYFECDLMRFATGEIERELNLLNPNKVWTWDADRRRPYRGYPKDQLPMWHVYRVEFWPHYGATSGIQDEHGNDLTFPAAFRKSRINHAPRGIVKVIQGRA